MMPLMGESLDFGFYYFKQQFKASLEQFYNFTKLLTKHCTEYSKRGKYGTVAPQGQLQSST